MTSLRCKTMASKEIVFGRPLGSAARECVHKESKGPQQKIDFLNSVKSCQAQELEKTLRKSDIDVNLRIRSGMTPLMHAAEKGSAECTNVLIKSAADVNLTDFNHKTALIYAVQCGSTECIRILIEAKADVNACSAARGACLFKAVSCGNEACVKLLCKLVADVNKTNNVGNSPLMFAAIYGHVEIIKCLVSFGADVNDVNKTSGQTPLMVALYKKNLLRLVKSTDKQFYSRPNRDLRCIKVLLELGAYVNRKDHCGRTALYIATNPCADAVRVLLKANAEITAIDRRKMRLPFPEIFYDLERNLQNRKILFAAGRTDDTCYMESFYRSHVEDRHSLRHLCRLTIRQRLSSNYPNRNMFVPADQLPLPNALKSFIVYDLL